MKKIKMKKLDGLDTSYEYQDPESGLKFTIKNNSLWWELRIVKEEDLPSQSRHWAIRSDTQSKLRDVMHKICFFNDWHPAILETNHTYTEIVK